MPGGQASPGTGADGRARPGTAAEAGSGADNAGKVGSEEAAGVREREWRRRLLI